MLLRKGTAEAAYQNPTSLRPQHHMMLPRIIKGRGRAISGAFALGRKPRDQVVRQSGEGSNQAPRHVIQRRCLPAALDFNRAERGLMA